MQVTYTKNKHNDPECMEMEGKEGTDKRGGKMITGTGGRVTLGGQVGLELGFNTGGVKVSL